MTLVIVSLSDYGYLITVGFYLIIVYEHDDCEPSFVGADGQQ